MISLTRGQEIFEKLKVQSKMGPGILYLLNTGISFEVSGRGLALELNYDDLTLVKEMKKDVLVVSWTEGKESYDIKFNLKDANEILQKIINYQR